MDSYQSKVDMQKGGSKVLRKKLRPPQLNLVTHPYTTCTKVELQASCIALALTMYVVWSTYYETSHPKCEKIFNNVLVGKHNCIIYLLRSYVFMIYICLVCNWSVYHIELNT